LMAMDPVVTVVKFGSIRGQVLLANY